MKEISFEEAVKELEGIVKKLEEGNVPLEESISLFERGMELRKLCAERLAKIEQKIEQVLKSGGDYKIVPFDEEQ